MKKIKKTLLAFLMITLALAFPGLVSADLENPVIGDRLGGTAADSGEATRGSTFAFYFVSLWNSLISVGAILVIVYFLWGSLEWITSGGDKGKLENARNKITQAIIGLILLVSSFVIIGFIGETFFAGEFDLLNLSLPNNL